MSLRPRPDDDWTVAQAALWYAAHGFPVFPVHIAPNGRCSCGKSDCEHPGKHPRTQHGFKDATTDAKQVFGWWIQWPDANIGLATGELSGILILDIDPRNGGDASWDSLVRQKGPLPATAEQITGGGGRHIAFADPGVAVPKELAPGIDVKSAGGYIIVAPSVHPSGGRYVWDGVEGAQALLNLAPPPAWLLDCFAKKLQDKHATQNTDGKTWKRGERNSKLTSLAGTMRRRSMAQESIEAALLEENRRRCDPSLSEAEVRRIASSVARYPPAAEMPRAIQADEWPEPIPFAHSDPGAIPAQCLPGWLGEMAQATAAHTETPFGLAALLSTAIASACIAGKAVISPEEGYCEPLNLYTCPAMESGNRKTAVFNKLLEPFGAWERERIEQIEPDRSRLASDRRTAEARIERLRKKAASAQDSAALIKEIRELEATLPAVPPSPRLYVDDCTPERLATLMAERGGRMAVFSDEGGVFDLLAGRYSKGVPNLDLWLKGHSVSPVRVDRADRQRPPILLDRPHLTVGISPQPDVLESLRDKPGFRGRGLLARFLYGLPKSLLGYRTLNPHPIPSDVERRYHRGIRQLLDFAPENEIRLALSRSAYDEWKDFQRALEIQFRDGGMLHGLRDWGSKLAGAALRLSGVFHLADEVGRVPFDAEVPKSNMLRALEFATCLISHAQAVFALMDRDPNIENAQRLIAWIGREGRPFFSVRDAFRAHQARFKRVDGMLPVLSLLEQHEYIRRVTQESSGGRKPSDVCEVNPRAALTGDAI